MAITLISRPEGHKLDTNLHDAVIYDDGAGNALVYAGTAHGLSDGDYVYIESNFDTYNGFKYVDAIAYDYFKIRNSETSDYVPFVQEAEISFYISVLQHGWQCVHLPIVYELQSDIAPNNIAEETYLPNTIVSQANIDGYTRINLAHALSYPNELSFIELIGAGPLAGKYQIINIANPWSVDIELAYDSTNVFTGYQVVRYYNNYFVSVNIYAGFEAGHRWESVKSFELAATLKLIPDSDNKVKFSIAEILRGYIETRNNLTLDTLPNNTDFHVSFYIEYFENYDISVPEFIIDGFLVIITGYHLEVFSGSITTDEYIGHAVNAMLPFKSLNMSFMSDYVDGSGSPARWLTTMDRPVAVVDHFFDLSFILQYSGFDVEVTINKYWQGVITDTEVIIIENPGSGVIRVPFTPESGYDQYCVSVISNGVNPETLDLSEFLQQALALRTAWTLGANPTVFLEFTGSINSLSSYRLYTPFSFVVGETYTITVVYTSDQNVTSDFTIGAYNTMTTSPVDSSVQNETTSGTHTATLTTVGTSTMHFIGFSIDKLTLDTGTNFTVLSAEISMRRAVTEEICIDIIEECGTTFTDDELRLTEDTDLRRLE